VRGPREPSGPAQVDTDVAQVRIQPRQGEVLAAADRQPVEGAPADVERGDGARPVDDPAVAECERRLADHAHRTRSRAAAHGHAPADEVPHVDSGRGADAAPAVAQGEGPREVARHVVVAEGREQAGTGLTSTIAVLLEHGADERRLPGGVDVGAPLVDGGVQRHPPQPGEGPDRRHQHVARVVDERPDTGGIGDVGLPPRGCGIDGGVRRELGHQLDEGVRRTPSQDGSEPRARHRLGRQAAGEAGGTEQDDASAHASTVPPSPSLAP
jgi:hypothetical protein